MIKKHSGISKIAKLLLTMAPALALAATTCFALIGEPKLPEKLKNTK